MSKEGRIYRRTLRKYKRALVKMAKQFQPWDFDFLTDILDKAFDIWAWYYNQSYNKMEQEDDHRGEISATLKQKITAYRNEDLFEKEALPDMLHYLADHIYELWD